MTLINEAGAAVRLASINVGRSLVRELQYYWGVRDSKDMVCNPTAAPLSISWERTTYVFRSFQRKTAQ